MNFIKIRFGNSLEEEFQKAIEEVFNLAKPALPQHECFWMPHVDVYESPDELVVLADLAGMNREEINIEINREKIKIAGVRKMMALGKNARYCLAEIPHGYFERNIILPRAVSAESAVASYADGILMIRVNKLPANVTQRIFVHTAD